VAVYQIILSIVLIVLSVLLSIVILLQQSRQAGLSGAISGATDSFLGKNKGRSADARLAQITKAIAICFFVLALATSLLLTLLG
jgi:preprotein translocase subunit SecG